MKAVRKLTPVTLTVLMTLLAFFAWTATAALADTAPTVTIEPASAVSYTTAHVSGTVNPNGGPSATTWSFQYSKNPAEEGWTPAGSGEFTGIQATEITPIAVEATLTGLAPNTTYQVRLVATNAGGEGVSAEPNPAFVTKEVTKPTLTIAAPSSVTTTAHFSGTVNPNAPGPEPQDPAFNTTWHFQCTPECPGLSGGEVAADNSTHEVSADASELLPNQTYTVTLVASNLGGQETAGSVSFTASAVKPTVEGEEATNLTKETATLNAKVNPNGDQVTSCTFEYGTQAGVYPSKAPCSPAPGAGRSPVPVSAAIIGLSAETNTYHWRLITGNSAGTTTGPDHTFIDSTQSPTPPGSCPQEQARQARGSMALPDCRAYELVTPPEKNGALIGQNFLDNVHPQISRDGSRLVAPSIQCFANPESCVASRFSEGVLYQFTRTGSGWSPRPLAPPASLETDTWEAFNADAGTALYAIPDAPQSFRDDFYARQEDGSLANLGPIGEHGIVLGEHGEEVHPNYEMLESEGLIATSDLSHMVYTTKNAVFPFDASESGPHVYEYAKAGASVPLLVGVSGGPGSTSLVSNCGIKLGGREFTQKNYGSMSEDGRTIYFTAVGRLETAGCPAVEQVWARVDGELADAHSVQISASAPASCKEAACKQNSSEAADLRDASFEGASSDGSKAFFTSTQQLTDGASESEGSALAGCNSIGGPGGCNLYESECPNGDRCVDPAERRLVDLANPGEGAPPAGGPRVQGVMAMSSDGSHVYFVARGVLTSATNARGEGAQEEAENLYVYSAGHLAFVAVLPESDAREWEPGQLRANVTPDGRFLVFTSHRGLTADVTREEGPAQVYEYDSLTGALVRVSIGEAGFNDDGNEGEGNATIVKAEFGAGFEAKTVPARADPSMSDDGAFVFFMSPVALTPGALNDVSIPGVGASPGGKLAQNVYEFHGGHVSLISDGKDTTGESRTINIPVELLGSDASGANVFFSTFDPLLPEDVDTQHDYYDARVCSDAEPCGLPAVEGVACGEGSCQAAGASAPAAVGAAAASEQYFGTGNLAPVPVTPVKAGVLTRAQKLALAFRHCRVKKNKHKRRLCEAHARKLYGPPHKARKAEKPVTARKPVKGVER